MRLLYLRTLFGISMVGIILCSVRITMLFVAYRSEHSASAQLSTAGIIQGIRPAVALAPPSVYQAVVAPTQPAPGIPVRLSIPSIKVDTQLEQVGLTPKGVLDVPKALTAAAWFANGPRPGDQGAAVIDGHHGWKDGVQTVFDTLRKLKIGDEIHVEDEQGIVLTFIVRELRTYGQTDDASFVFESTDDAAHLNLITCDGEWNETEKNIPTGWWHFRIFSRINDNERTHP